MQVSVGRPTHNTQNEGLDDYLVGLVSRLGGLLGFRDLRDAESVAALEKEQLIRRFRELALEQGSVDGSRTDDIDPDPTRREL